MVDDPELLGLMQHRATLNQLIVQPLAGGDDHVIRQTMQVRDELTLKIDKMASERGYGPIDLLIDPQVLFF